MAVLSVIVRSGERGPVVGDSASLRHLLGHVQARRSLTCLPAERFAAAYAAAQQHARDRRRPPGTPGAWVELAWAHGLDIGQREALMAAERELDSRLRRVRPSSPPAPPNRFERALELASSSTGGLSSLLGAASQRVRNAPGAAGDEALTDVVAGVALPTIVGYARWVLEEARRAGILALYAAPRAATVLDVVERLAGPAGDGPKLFRLPWDRVPVPPGDGVAVSLGLPDRPRIAVLEVGWSGALGGEIAGLIERSGGGPPVLSLSFGLASGGERGGVERRAYLFDRARGLGPRLEDAPVRALVEAFCDESVRPDVLGALELAELDDDLVDRAADLRPVVTGLLTDLVASPTAGEARRWTGLAAGAERDGAPHRWPAAQRRLRPAPVRWVTGRPLAAASRVRRRSSRAVRQWRADRLGDR